MNNKVYENRFYQWYIIIKYNYCKIVWKTTRILRKFFPKKKELFYGWTEIEYAVLNSKTITTGPIIRDKVKKVGK